MMIADDSKPYFFQRGSPSLHLPVHSWAPHGFLSLMNRSVSPSSDISRYSTRRIEYACPVTSPRSAVPSPSVSSSSSLLMLQHSRCLSLRRPQMRPYNSSAVLKNSACSVRSDPDKGLPALLQLSMPIRTSSAYLTNIHFSMVCNHADAH